MLLDTSKNLADLSYLNQFFLYSRVAQLVEQPAVNRLVAGSSPAAGASFRSNLPGWSHPLLSSPKLLPHWSPSLV